MKTTITFLAVLLTLWFVATTPAVAADTPPHDSRVIDVYVRDRGATNNFVQRGQSLTIVVTNLEPWLGCNAVSNNLPRGLEAKRGDLVPFINGIAMVGSKYLRSTFGANNTEKLVFKLDRDAADATSKENWKQLFNSVGMFQNRNVSVSIGLPGSWQMETDVRPWRQGKAFSFVTVPINAISICGLIMVLAVLALFWYQAANTDIIRDPYAALRPDGKAPFSLARTQMAFWFFLVLASYFLLYAMTGDKDTIPGSILALIGISAGTALGSAFVDAGKGCSGERSQYFQKPRPGLVEELVKTKEEQQQKLMDTLKAIEQLPGSALVELEKRKKEQQKIEEDLHRTDVQLTFYKSNTMQRFMSDIHGDDGTVGFHRYQMAVWTVVLGIIFVKEVISEIAMPEFSNTLLALMGISGGTYIGFKIPTAKS